MKTRVPASREREQGQTIVLMAISLVTLLGIAALAIDVSALYVTRNEAQRAADAAALAGARIFATSSFVTAPASFTPTDLCTNGGAGSTSAVNKVAEAAAGENLVSGQAPTLTNIFCTMTAGNPTVRVTVTRTGMPRFLSRLWNSTPTTISATSAAEAYNSSGLTVTPTVKGVKPWLVPNCDPNTYSGPTSGCAAHEFVTPGTGAIVGGGSFIGQSINLTRINTVNAPTAPNPGSFYPLNLASTARSCPAATSPSCGNVLSDNYEDDISCASNTEVSCGTNSIAVLIAGTGYGTRTRRATRCLIHSDNEGLGNGQDQFSAPGTPPPITITGGNNNPIPGLFSQQLGRSDSVVTVPLYDGITPVCTGAGVCTTTIDVVGFLQLGVTQTVTFAPGGPQVRAVILNAVGCNGALGGVVSGNSTPITVRLIHQ
jgi:hypothetical protein